MRTANGRRQVLHLLRRPVLDDNVCRVVLVRGRCVCQQFRYRSSGARYGVRSHDGAYMQFSSEPIIHDQWRTQKIQMGGQHSSFPFPPLPPSLSPNSLLPSVRHCSRLCVLRTVGVYLLRQFQGPGRNLLWGNVSVWAGSHRRFRAVSCTRA